MNVDVCYGPIMGLKDKNVGLVIMVTWKDNDGNGHESQRFFPCNALKKFTGQEIDELTFNLQGSIDCVIRDRLKTIPMPPVPEDFGNKK